MAQPSRVESAEAVEPPEASAAASPRVLELERRIEELEGLDESRFGRFTAWDWLACLLGALVVPAAILWWFGR